MKIRKELWFGFALMALLIAGALYILLSAETITRGHLGLLMLSLVVVAIMMGFPTAFTLMGMGILFTWLSYDKDIEKTLDLFVQSTFKVMSNDVLISIPLFVFMGYLVERANLIEKLFRSLHLAMARIPGSLAVATLVTCAVFATATGIVGAVVTLMGLLAFPAMLKAGYNSKLGAGAVTAGGCLGILIPPSVMLIVYGATAGVSVVQLYAGAFLPGLMLAGLYVAYVIIVAKVWPHMAPPLSEEGRNVKLPPVLEALSSDGSRRALPAVLGAFRGRTNANIRTADLARQAGITLTPLLFFAFVMAEAYIAVTAPPEAASTLQQMDSSAGMGESREAGGLAEPEGVQEPPSSSGDVKEPPGADAKEPPSAAPAAASEAPTAAAEAPTAQPAPIGFWIALGVGTLALVLFYAIFSIKRLEIFRMLLASFFPLVVLILAVLGSIVFGLTTPTEAAAIGAFGGFVLAAVYMLINYPSAQMRKILLVWVPLWVPFLASIVWFRLALAGVVPSVPTWFGLIAIIGIGIWSILALRQAKLMDTVRESSFLTAKTSAMVCWLFVGSAIFSSAFALLGGQELVEKWVLSMNLSKTEFMLLSQVIIFILGWPLEWTEIIVIFMPIFVPLLDKFGVDPLFFGLLVALNLQTAFLSPPVAMAAFYLKGVSPPHVTLNQIFAGMMPFMAIQVVAIFLLYLFPQIGLWIPSMVYGK
ncbi:MAG TPA: TRAP transporter large permease subunit [Burkholderiaceae bacterium]|nr:TRAP transporter large permease subunit [Burkholderiaceae bacterium]